MAFLFALSSRVNSTLITSLMAFFAALMTLSAFIADIAMVIFVMHRMKQLSDTYEVTVTSACTHFFGTPRVKIVADGSFLSILADFCVFCALVFLRMHCRPRPKTRSHGRCY